MQNERWKSLHLSSEQYFTMVRGAKKSGDPLQVHEMSQNEIYNCKETARKLKNTTKDVKGEKIRWREIRELAISDEDPQYVYNVLHIPA